MQIMIAEDRLHTVRMRGHPPQHLQRLGAAIDQVADKENPVASRIELQRPEQQIELVKATLYITNHISCHADPVGLRGCFVGSRRNIVLSGSE